MKVLEHGLKPAAPVGLPGDDQFERTEIPCAICGPGAPYRVRYEEQIQGGPVNFAARKTPTRQHFRIVQCSHCGLVYSNPIFPVDAICQLYRDSPFIQEAQLERMVRDYQTEVKAILPLLERRERLLEIGCSSGFFLEAAQALGFKEVWGVEPGVEAAARARPAIRPRIVNALFNADLFPAATFDLVCCFQVLDHLLDPSRVLRDVLHLLRPGGMVLLLNHNIRSWFPRLLGERCPMYDIEHIYLFDKNTVARLLENNGFDVVTIRNTSNSYTLGYALKMFPMPRLLKSGLLSLTQLVGASQWRVRLAAGNMVSVGRKGR
jgi:SAM-dependent methyltransferase